MHFAAFQTPLVTASDNPPGILGNHSKVPEAGGSHRNKSSSFYSLVLTLVPSFLLALVLLSIFVFIRSKLRRLYAPRTFIDTLTEQEKTPADSDKPLAWLKYFTTFEDTDLLNWQSLDAYLYVRFFKIIVVTCFFGFLLVGSVLIPVNATGGGGQKQLDLLSFSNVADPRRYWAHAIVAWVFFGFVLFMITRETIFLIHLRQAYLLSPWNSSKISSRTVLFTSVPKHYCDKEKIKGLFDEVKTVWLVEDFKELEDMVEKMDKTAMKLEAAEIKLIRDANAKRLKMVKDPKANPDDHDTDHWLAVTRRPKHRHDKFNFIWGNKFDTIAECQEDLRKIIPSVEAAQKLRRDGDSKLLGAVFVEFETQSAAQAAFSLVSFNHPERIVPRQVGVHPNEVLWKNLRMSDWEALGRKLLAFAFVIVLTIFWGVPVAAIASFSNVNYLAEKYTWLAWLNRLNGTQLGLLTGLVPALLLSLLQSLVPRFYRYIARQSGAVTLSHVELRTQTYFFVFSLIQVFLVTTFSSGVTAVIGQIALEPRSAPALLAENLPKASNFYISYFVLYGILISAVQVFNPLALFWNEILPRIWPYSTPRESFIKYVSLDNPGYGSECAKWTNLAVIAISYSCIAPLVLGFATIGFVFIYLAMRYNFFYVFSTEIDTKGAFYAQALQQLTVGIYIAELCLIGLFSTRVTSDVSANGPLMLMVVLFSLTIVYQYLMRETLTPLTELLPRNLLAETEADYESRLSSDSASSSNSPDGSNKKDRKNKNKNSPDDEASSQHPRTQPLLAPDHAAREGRAQHRAGSMHHPARINDIYGHERYKKVKDNFRRWFAPHSQSPAALASTLHPSLREPVPPYPEAIAKLAFVNPVVTREPPTLWIVRDEMRISEREIGEARREVDGLDVRDDGAWLDEKNVVQWEKERLREMPLWHGRVVY
ncbi:phosphate metabolism protein 7 [Diplodia intermedia]|uniref:Phosphate metabolism protein 7 n=1 Tax=Diplodia intermedia TaxID=856260 RepID=A0ABR3TV59_9PEZI